MQTYTVLPGDTLYGISKQFGISVDAIRRANNLSSDNITVGQTLNIPSSGSTTIYIVKSGDNLYSIANKYNTTVTELMSLNNLPSNALSIGQSIKIPVNTSNNGSASNSNNNYIIYTVKSGDNLYDIANKYNTTIDNIEQLNNLSSSLLSIGQTLKIPTSNTQQSGNNYINYIVRRGDSLYAIARKFNMTVDELIDLNNLKSNVLSIGQSLKVKGATISVPTVVKECFGEGYSEPNYQTYIVKSGDSLYIIARKFNTSVDNLVNLNNLTSNNLQIGQVLKIKEIE